MDWKCKEWPQQRLQPHYDVVSQASARIGGVYAEHGLFLQGLQKSKEKYKAGLAQAYYATHPKKSLLNGHTLYLVTCSEVGAYGHIAY